jgi:hypothetical protein
MKKFTLFMAIAVLLAAFFVAGCVNSPGPTASPAPTVTLQPTSTAVPSPTLIGRNDEAHIQFYYSVATATDYSGLPKASPGKIFYILDVQVSSDKPVQTSADWITLEYKVNDTDPVKYMAPFTSLFKVYPSKIIGGDNGSTAEGRLMYEMPAQLAAGYPKAVYFLPLNQQQGQYKVYDPVYGSLGLH